MGSLRQVVAAAIALSSFLMSCIAAEQVVLQTGDAFHLPWSPIPGSHAIRSPQALRAFKALALHEGAAGEGRAADVFCEVYKWRIPRTERPARMTIPASVEVGVLTNKMWAFMFDATSSNAWLAYMDPESNRIWDPFGPMTVTGVIETLEQSLNLIERAQTAGAAEQSGSDNFRIPFKRVVLAVAFCADSGEIGHPFRFISDTCSDLVGHSRSEATLVG